MKKIGIICLALVVAMGAIGVGYAHWSDTITITQRVDTGSVLVGVFGVGDDAEEVEGKDVADVEVYNGIEVGADSNGAENGEPKFAKEIEEGDLRGASLIGPGTYDFYDGTTIAISSMYPSFTVREDFYIGNAGTIPVKLMVGVSVTDPDGLYDNMTVSWLVTHNDVDVANGSGVISGELPNIVAALEGIQMHPCDIVAVWIDKHLMQESTAGKEASFTITVEGMQWNLYTPPVQSAVQ